MIHELKCQYEYFERLLDGSKTHETRLNDRDYQTGDTLVICQLIKGSYTLKTGKSLKFKVTHVLENSHYVKPGFCIMSIKPEEPSND